MKKPTYIHDFTDRHGKRRVYFRKGDYSKDMRPHLPFYSDAWNDAYADALKQSGAGRTRRAKAGSIADLIAKYYVLSDYPTHAEETRRTYKTQLEKIREEHGHRMVSDLERQHIIAVRNDLNDDPDAANKWLRYIKMLMNFAIDIDWRKDNPALRIKKVKTDGDGWPPWPQDLIQQYGDYWPLGTRQRVGLELFRWTAQRVKDVAVMHRNSIEGDIIKVVQHKTRNKIWIPLHPALRQAIDAYDYKGMFLMESAQGRPYSPKSLGMRFTDWAQSAGVPKGYSAHGLRKSMGEQLAENDATAHQIKAMLGHSTLKEAERYTRSADQKRMARQAIAKLEPKKNAKLQT